MGEHGRTGYPLQSGSGPSSSARRAVTICRPRCQVSMMVKTMSAMSSVTQPPWVTLVRLAAKKVSSVPPKTTATSTSRQVAQCQRARATTRNSVVVRRNVPVTATPYAVASRSEDRNSRTTSATATNSPQLIPAT
jgi:hypothetical protein